MEYQGVIFDFNGTLFFDSAKHLLAWQKVAKEFGKHLTSKELSEHFHGVPNAEGIKYLTSTLSEEEVLHYSLLKESYYRDFCLQDKESLHLVDGATEYFDYLKRNKIPFTIASASIKENMDFFIEQFHLDHWIDVNSIIYDNGSYLNKVEMFKDAAHNINVDTINCLIFEDSYAGVKSASMAGCKNIIVVDEFETGELSSMEHVIQTIHNYHDLSE